MQLCDWFPRTFVKRLMIWFLPHAGWKLLFYKGDLFPLERRVFEVSVNSLVRLLSFNIEKLINCYEKSEPRLDLTTSDNLRLNAVQFIRLVMSPFMDTCCELANVPEIRKMEWYLWFYIFLTHPSRYIFLGDLDWRRLLGEMSILSRRNLLLGWARTRRTFWLYLEHENTILPVSLFVSCVISPISTETKKMRKPS